MAQETKKEESTKLNVKAASPFKVHFEGEANSVTAINKTGPFDVLPGHANFISVLDECTIKIRTEEENITVPIKKGIMKVYSNDVNIFVNV